MNVSRMTIITKCGDCPHLDSHLGICQMVKEDNRIFDVDHQPKWCPLPTGENLQDDR